MECRVRHSECSQRNVKEGRPGMWAGDVPLRGAPFPHEGPGANRGDFRAEALISGLPPGLKRPRGPNRSGAVVVQVCYPVGCRLGDTQPAPAYIHSLLRHRVEGPANVPTGEEQGGVGALGMFKTVEVDHQSRVGTMALLSLTYNRTQL